MRTTEGVGILIEPSSENVDRLLRALASWGEGYVRDLTREDFAIVPGAVRLVEDYPLDMFCLIEGKTFAEYLPETRLSADGFRYLSPAALIETKTHTRREKDLIDVLALREIQAKENKA